MKTISKKFDTLKDVKVGSVLLAKPFVNYNIYERAVILIVSKNEEGYYGVILNKDTSQEFEFLYKGERTFQNLYLGGDLLQTNLYYIHNNHFVHGCNKVDKDIYFQGDYENLKYKLNEGDFQYNEIRFFVGLSFFTYEDLGDEFNDQWWVCNDCSFNELFLTNSDHLWSNKLTTKDHLYGLFEYIQDPCLN